MPKDTSTDGPTPAVVDQIRAEVFAEVARGLNIHADIWEHNGSDPCRVRVARELANAHRAYAEGYGQPAGSTRAASHISFDVEES